MDVDCRWPGPLHDAKIFVNSMVCKSMPSNKIPTTYYTLILGQSKIPNTLLVILSTHSHRTA